MSSLIIRLKEYSREVLAQESADFTQGPLMSSCKHFWSYVNIFEVKQLADDVIILKLIVTSSYGEESGPCAQPNRVATPNSLNFGLQ